MTKIIILLFLISCSIFSQHKVYQNFDLNNSEKELITTFLQDYFNKNKPLSELFCKDDIEAFKTIDVASFSSSLGGSLLDISYDVNILNLKKEGDYYIAKCLLYWENQNESDNEKTITTLAILNLKIKKENNLFKLTNYINHYTRNWIRTKVGNIEYIYHPEHPFNIENARKANLFLSNLLDSFKIKEVPNYRYYISKNCDDLFKVNGFDYFIPGSSQNNLCGFIDQDNQIIYSSTAYGEIHLHEIIHVINNHFPNGNSYIKIGLSCYINDAGAGDLPLLYHVNKFEKYLNENKFNFEEFENTENLDDITNISYVLGSLICNAIYRKGGLPLLLEYLNCTPDDDISLLKIKIKKDFKVTNLEDFFKKEIEIYKKQKKPLLYIE
ncbi:MULTISPECIES: hypothetical protein [Flavobacterium]|uniref:Peptidase MA superfamily protein n=1 Tax=Flavobacterium jumunjinense TaxID=998845 RepID=A0ABV5GM57_9FLAO|nr:MULTISPECIES: hypothetical protein [Flavobacterium]